MCCQKRRVKSGTEWKVELGVRVDLPSQITVTTAGKDFNLIFMLTFDPKGLAFCAAPRQKCPITENEHS